MKFLPHWAIESYIRIISLPRCDEISMAQFSLELGHDFPSTNKNFLYSHMIESNDYSQRANAIFVIVDLVR